MRGRTNPILIIAAIIAALWYLLSRKKTPSVVDAQKPINTDPSKTISGSSTADLPGGGSFGGAGATTSWDNLVAPSVSADQQIKKEVVAAQQSSPFFQPPPLLQFFSADPVNAPILLAPAAADNGSVTMDKPVRIDPVIGNNNVSTWAPIVTPVTKINANIDAVNVLNVAAENIAPVLDKTAYMAKKIVPQSSVELIS